jgi:DNA-binding MarR family transcriptional regulator
MTHNTRFLNRVYTFVTMMSDAASKIAGPPAADFKLLTNHGQTLLLISYDPRARMRDIAALLNITERAAQRIVADLVRAGYVQRQRDGRRNRYSVRTELPLTLPIQHDIQVGSLLAALLPQPEPTDTATH